MASVASTTSEVEARGRGGGAAGAGAGLSPERDGSWAFKWGLRGQSAFGYFGCRFRGCRARGPGRIGAAAIGAWPRPGSVVVARCRRGLVGHHPRRPGNTERSWCWGQVGTVVNDPGVATLL